MNLTITMTNGRTRNYAVISVETVGEYVARNGVAEMMIVEGNKGALYMFTVYTNGSAALSNLKGDGPEVMTYELQK